MSIWSLVGELGKTYGSRVVRDALRQMRGSGASLGQVQQALETAGTVLTEGGTPAGRRILEKVNPALLRQIDTTRQAGAQRAIDKAETLRSDRLQTRAGTPAPEPQWQQTLRPGPAPEPQFGAGRRLAQEDPEMARRFQRIAESTARERGVSAESVMNAMAGPQGTEAPLLRELRRTYDTYPSSTPAPFPSWERNLLTAPTFPSDVPAPEPQFGAGRRLAQEDPEMARLSPSGKEIFLQRLLSRAARPDMPVEVSRTITPIEGRQLGLDLRNPAGAEALVEFKTTRGAIRPAGTKLGGTPYSGAPYAVPPRTEFPTFQGGPTKTFTPGLSDVTVYEDSPAARQASVMRYFAGQKGDVWDLTPEIADLQVSDPQGFLTLSKIADNISTDLNLPQKDVLQALVTKDTDALKRFAEMPDISPQAADLAGATVEATQQAADIAPIVRNAVGGVRQIDLRKLGVPAAALGAGATGLVGSLLYFGNRGTDVPGSQQLTDAQLYPPQGSRLSPADQPFVDPSAASLTTPVVGGQGAPVGGQTPLPGQMGAGSVVIRMNDSASNQRQANQNATAGAGVFQPTQGMYKTPKDFYRAASAYARQPGVAANIAEQLATQSARMGQADMQNWIARHPDLAYQLMLKNAPRDVSQQSPNIQEAELLTSLGSNNNNNMVGNVSEAVKVAGGAPADLKEATDPRLAVSLKPMPRDLQSYFNRPGFAGTTRLY